MTKSEIVSGPGGTAFVGPAAVSLVQAVAIKCGLQMYVSCGMKPNAAYAPKNMMRVAAHITGKTYKARAYTQAIEDLTAWIEQRKAEIPVRSA